MSFLRSFAGAAVLTFTMSAGAAADFSLRRSEASIRDRILNEVPLGSSIARVEQQIAGHQWKVTHVNLNGGFFDRRTRPYKVTGEKSMEAWIGDYRGLPFKVDVSVYWAFDANGSLIDVWVYKEWDSL